MQKIRRLIEIQVENQIVPAVKLDEWVVRNLRVIQFSHEPVRIERKILKSRWKSMKVKEERNGYFTWRDDERLYTNTAPYLSIASYLYNKFPPPSKPRDERAILYFQFPRKYSLSSPHPPRLQTPWRSFLEIWEKTSAARANRRKKNGRVERREAFLFENSAQLSTRGRSFLVFLSRVESTVSLQVDDQRWSKVGIGFRFGRWMGTGFRRGKSVRSSVHPRDERSLSRWTRFSYKNRRHGNDPGFTQISISRSIRVNSPPAEYAGIEIVSGTIRARVPRVLRSDRR